MKLKILVTVMALMTCAGANAQGKGKLDRYLNILITGKMDTVSSFSIDKTLTKKAGWGIIYNAMTKAFISNGFPVVERTSAGGPDSYVILIDYEYHGTQFSNLRGQIIDMGNAGQIIGTITYDKKFEADDLSEGIAYYLKSKSPVIQKTEARKETVAKEEPQSNKAGRSKEERLRELKDLYEKQLITKEDYDKAKQKILEEQ